MLAWRSVPSQLRRPLDHVAVVVDERTGKPLPETGKEAQPLDVADRSGRRHRAELGGEVGRSDPQYTPADDRSLLVVATDGHVEGCGVRPHVDRRRRLDRLEPDEAVPRPVHRLQGQAVPHVLDRRIGCVADEQVEPPAADRERLG